MAEHITSKNIIPPEDATAFDEWALPDVSASLPPRQETNLFGHKNPEPQKTVAPQPVVAPPTMAEIEAIRADAEREGFEEGNAAGFKEGMEKGRQEGIKQGHAEGLAQGQAQGKSQGLTQAKALLDRFERLMAQFCQPLALLDVEIEQSLLAVVEQLSRSVIGHELQTHPEQILAALRQGIDALPMKEQKITIRMHPQDVTLVQSLYGDEQLSHNQWQLEKDPGLKQGDCLISCQRSQVDMRLEPRLQEVFSSVLAQRQQLEKTAQQLAPAAPADTGTEQHPQGEPTESSASAAQITGAADGSTQAPSS
ncbi:flagellar assembly protein FliH [Shewanella sp. YIC-542]|uniref:flagellar assembly protein FliH n=1 Tax=Shewanella mytili TaxID=3377111 RepID=UPI00398F068A